MWFLIYLFYMSEQKKVVIELSASSELPFIDAQKNELNYYKKFQYKNRVNASKFTANESERIKKEFGKICKQVKQSFGFCKNPQAADLNHQLVIKDGCQKPMCTFQRIPSKRKNTTQPSHQEVKEQLQGPFPSAYEILEDVERREFSEAHNNNLKFGRRLKPLSNILMKRLETDYLSIQKMRLNEKKFGSQRELNFMLGIRSETKMNNKPNETPENGQRKIQATKELRRKMRQIPQESKQIEKKSVNSTYKIKSKAISTSTKKQKVFHVPFETYYYRDMLWKVNFSNQIYIQTPLQYEHRLKLYIGKGNNSAMIRGLAKRRIWFAVTDRIEDANYVWTQLKHLPYFQKQEKLNNLEIELTPQNQYNSNGFLTARQYVRLEQYFSSCRNLQERTDERLCSRSKSFMKYFRKVIKISEIKQQRMQNHFPNNYVIGNKKALLKLMTIFYKQNDDFVFNYLPYSFHVSEGLEDEHYLRFLRHYYQRGKQIRNSGEKEENIWIVKPGENSNRGIGIRVCKSLDDIKSIVKQRQKHTDGTYKTYIIQSYVEKPLLYHKRKFDIRHFMMLTSVNGILKGYWYRDGYIRTSSSEYTTKNADTRVHLTNDAVQKQQSDYGKYEKGNKISYDQIDQYLSRLYGYKNYKFKEIIIPKMKRITTDIMKACSGSIDPELKGSNFELFGLDFMIDSEFNLWLIEVNTNPCLEISCPLLGQIIPRMMENLLQLTLDTAYPPPVRYTPKGVHYSKKLEEQNRFDLIYDSRIDGIFSQNIDKVIDSKLQDDEDEVFEDDGQQWNDD